MLERQTTALELVNSLNELLDKTSTRSTTETNQNGGHHDNDDDDGFDLDRPSTDVAHFLEKLSTLSKPRFSNVANLQQRKEKSAQLLRAGAKQLGMAQK
ncbi:Myosin-like protein [Globisporangium polare]